VGGAPVLTDAWGLDFVLTGSQKALALPPGLALGVASERMLARAATLPDRGVYFDLCSYQENVEKHQTPNTPALSLMHALNAQLARIRAEGVEARWGRHQAMAERCWSWAEGLGRTVGEGFRVLAAPGFRSPTVTCIGLPGGLAGPAVTAGMAARGFVIGGGYGKLKQTTVRIGHMGDHTVEELDGVLDALEDVLRGLRAREPAVASAHGARP
jgi:aspartate aminotransferase-like enzyme